MHKITSIDDAKALIWALMNIGLTQDESRQKLLDLRFIDAEQDIPLVKGVILVSAEDRFKNLLNIALGIHYGQGEWWTPWFDQKPSFIIKDALRQVMGQYINFLEIRLALDAALQDMLKAAIDMLPESMKPEHMPEELLRAVFDVSSANPLFARTLSSDKAKEIEENYINVFIDDFFTTKGSYECCTSQDSLREKMVELFWRHSIPEAFGIKPGPLKWPEEYPDFAGALDALENHKDSRLYTIVDMSFGITTDKTASQEQIGAHLAPQNKNYTKKHDAGTLGRARIGQLRQQALRWLRYFFDRRKIVMPFSSK